MSLGFEPPVVHGELWCHRCLAKTWFVSWDELHNGPEHAECRECGFCYGEAEERVVDPKTGTVSLKRRPVLDPEVYRAARDKMQKDFAREVMAIDIAHGQPPGTGAMRAAKIAAERTAELVKRLHGSNPTNR